MSFFKTDPCFVTFSDIAPVYTPAKRLKEMQDRAKFLLCSRTIDEQKAGSITVAWLIGDYFSISLENWISDQIEEGFPSLASMPTEERTESALREFVEKSHGENLEFENEDNTSELTALLGSLHNYMNFFYGSLEYGEFKDGRGYEYLAIHALELVGYAIDEFTYGDGERWQQNIHLDAPAHMIQDLINATVDVTEVVALAEGMHNTHLALKWTEKKFNDDALSTTKKAEELAKKIRSVDASRAASVRHEKMVIARRAIEIEWSESSSGYESRADFARIISKRDGLLDRTVYQWISNYEKTKR